MLKTTTTALMFVALLALPAPGYAQRAVPVPTPGVGPLVFHRFVAVTHLRDYLQQELLNGWGAWATRTLLFGVNGTERVANVGVYVLGAGGPVVLSRFTSIDPAQVRSLLPSTRYFGGSRPPGSGDHLDEDPPPYVGETIVVVSSEPVIVTGVVLRGAIDFGGISDLAATLPTISQSARTFDVRQFDCTVPEEFRKVAVFCRNLAPVEPN